jgi:hypothetical protein
MAPEMSIPLNTLRRDCQRLKAPAPHLLDCSSNQHSSTRDPKLSINNNHTPEPNYSHRLGSSLQKHRTLQIGLFETANKLHNQIRSSCYVTTKPNPTHTHFTPARRHPRMATAGDSGIDGAWRRLMNHQSIRRLLVSNKVGGMWKFWDERRIKGGAPLVVGSAGRPLEDGSSEPKSTTAFPHFPNSPFRCCCDYYSSVILLSFLQPKGIIHSTNIVNLLLQGGIGMQAYPSDHSVDRGMLKTKFHSLLRRFKNCLSMKCGPTGVRSTMEYGVEL